MINKLPPQKLTGLDMQTEPKTVSLSLILNAAH
jgi:hypothetical protein